MSSWVDVIRDKCGIKKPFIGKWISMKSHRDLERRHIYIEISKTNFATW